MVYSHSVLVKCWDINLCFIQGKIWAIASTFRKEDYRNAVLVGKFQRFPNLRLLCYSRFYRPKARKIDQIGAKLRRGQTGLPCEILKVMPAFIITGRLSGNGMLAICGLIAFRSSSARSSANIFVASEDILFTFDLVTVISALSFNLVTSSTVASAAV